MEEHDINLRQFVSSIFVQEPQAKSTYQLTLPEDVRIQDFLGYFLVLGAKELYGRQLGELSPREIEHLRAYLQSIGWDVLYSVQSETVVEEETKTPTLVNKYLIDFHPV